ncbi:MAG: RluA family pseudouridine synthase [Oscillochloridaceae bacterium umkhey_bin13]
MQPYEPQTHLVQADQAGLTVEELAEQIAGSAGLIAARRGGAWLGQRRVEPATQPVAPGDQLTLRFPPGGHYADYVLQTAQICYEDPWLLVLDKPSGMYVAATPWDTQGTVLAALTRFLLARDGVAPPLHLAHRLDRDTSGLLLISKHPGINGPLQAAFAEGRVQKQYLGLCSGLPNWEQQHLQTGHGRSAGGRWRIYPLEEVGRILPMGGGKVKLAHTSFHVQTRLNDAALIVADLHTGRTHQIRLHLAHLGHPLLGDQRYGGPAHYQEHPLAGHMLHAATLSLRHPHTGEGLRFSSDLPAAFQQILLREG